jgi:hypothetical protein
VIHASDANKLIPAARGDERKRRYEPHQLS